MSLHGRETTRKEGGSYDPDEKGMGRDRGVRFLLGGLPPGHARSTELRGCRVRRTSDVLHVGRKVAEYVPLLARPAFRVAGIGSIPILPSLSEFRNFFWLQIARKEKTPNYFGVFLMNTISSPRREASIASPGPNVFWSMALASGARRCSSITWRSGRAPKAES